MKKDFSIYKNRRQSLLNAIKNNFPAKKGKVIIFASFEHEHYKFRQNSSFYYLTGLEEPAIVLSMELDGSATLYMPQYGESRSKWMPSEIYNASKENLVTWGLNGVDYLGNACKGYTMAPSCVEAEYAKIIELIKSIIKNNESVFTLYPTDRYTQSNMIINQLTQYISNLRDHIVDISPIVASMRRTKSQVEIEEIFKAVDCTMVAHEAVAQIIDQDKYEYNVQAAAEFIFTDSGATASFPSIVASGINSTVLHYMANKSLLKKGDLVLVDIGADLNHYCGDLTRTYPVSGTFNKRQLEVYKIVLETQEYLENIAKPGYWLSNKNQQEKSLNHLALKFLEKKGYAKYFTHGIGHFLGMDVHDVGDLTQPLQINDIITIEPGIYIPEEKLGIRIEDNYMVVADGVMRLSYDLPRDPHKIEDMMVHQDIDEDDSDA